MRKYEVFHYIPEPITGFEFPISIGFVWMTGKQEEDAIAFPNEEIYGYSYVEES